MKDAVTLTGDGIVLRLAGRSDAEFLRTLKNSNKAGFFHKDEISPEQQASWFEDYLKRDDDFLFIVGERLGVVGIRLRNGEADCYGIVAVPEARGTGVMKKAMKLMTDWAWARWGKPVTLFVLSENDARNFYPHCGFVDAGPGPEGSRKLVQRRPA